MGLIFQLSDPGLRAAPGQIPPPGNAAVGALGSEARVPVLLSDHLHALLYIIYFE